MSFTVAQVAEAVAGRVVGDARLQLRAVAPLEDAGPDDLSFLASPVYRERAAGSRAGCLIVGTRDEWTGRTLIVTSDPYRAFAVALRLFHPPATFAPGVAPSACVDETAAVAPDAHVGPGALVGARARVGARSAILGAAVVGDDCAVGSDCVLHPGVVLYPRTTLGDRVVVHANAVLGADGFGYSSGADGHVKVPQVGRVVVEDDVEIGAGSCIDRATLGETRIGAGTKIDNLVQVGHNVVVGERCLMVAQSGISGSTTLGRFVAIGGQAGVAGHLRVGDGVRVAAKSAVFADLEDGTIAGGIPAVPHTRWKRIAAALSRLPELLHRVRRLEDAVGQGASRAAGTDAGRDDDHVRDEETP